MGFQPVDRASVHGIEDRVADDMARIAARAQAPQPPAAPRLEPADLAEIVSGLRIRQLTPFGNMHVKITVDPRTDRELEVFAQLGKGGDVATSDLEAICRMISLWLRSGGSLRHVIKQLEGIGSSLQIPTKFGRIMSLGDGLACALKKYMRAKERFGLKPLLLGEVDLSQLDTPRTPAVIDHVPGAATERRSDEATKGDTPTPPGKVTLLAAVTDDLIKKGIKAGDWIKAVAPIVEGGGGGPPTMAQAGGKNPAKLGEALEAGKAWVVGKL